MSDQIDPQTPVTELSGVGSKFKSKLANLDIHTAEDLLWHTPSRYEDYSRVAEISSLEKGDKVTISGEIQDIDIHRSWKKKYTIFKAEIGDDTGSIKAVWFNQPYLKNTLKPETKINISGEVTTHKGEVQFSNPIYEKIKGNQELIHTARIVPIYPETKGLTSRGLRYLIYPLLGNVEIEETLPEEVLEQEKLPNLEKSLNKIHFPENQKEIKKAETRFAFEDLFLLQMYNLKKRQELKSHPSHIIDKDIEFLKNQIENLPFELTGDQKKALWEIIQDMGEENPMSRLMQGDVGSGKTVVAILASMHVAYHEIQAAFMAPTEILAKQHYETLTELFPHFAEGAALLTGNESEIYFGEGLREDLNKKELIKKINKGEVKLIFGTHALLQDKVSFDDLGLVTVDEQHRFGVEQRAALTKNQEEIPHFMSMSATPIPRTLSLTIFGDLDMSIIQELPKNRKPTTTRLIPPSKREDAYGFIGEEVEKGRQVFVICPRIQRGENEKKDSVWSDVKAVEEEYKKLDEEIFPKIRVGKLHGKLSPAKKNETMEKFSKGEISILVSTSVVEVGIDVPNATIMMVEGADRFGLAQLYQFQGRVGRGEHKSYCLLFTNSTSDSTLKRLNSVVEAEDGLELAEKDLQLRGPGEFIGQSQSGMPDLAMKAIQNPQLVSKTKKAAKNFVKNYELENYPHLLRRLDKFENKVHEE